MEKMSKTDIDLATHYDCGVKLISDSMQGVLMTTLNHKQSDYCWIPVSESLPTEDDGEVLVRMEDGRLEFAYATGLTNIDKPEAHWAFRNAIETALPESWMRIPGANARIEE